MLKEQLIAARKAKKVTQVQMAKHLKMARSGYAKFELAGKTVSFDQIDTICSVLGVRVVLISEAEFEARNALKSNPAYYDLVMARLWEQLPSQKSTETPK